MKRDVKEPWKERVHCFVSVVVSRVVVAVVVTRGIPQFFNNFLCFFYAYDLEDVLLPASFFSGRSTLHLEGVGQMQFWK